MKTTLISSSSPDLVVSHLEQCARYEQGVITNAKIDASLTLVIQPSRRSKTMCHGIAVFQHHVNNRDMKPPEIIHSREYLIK